MVIDFHAALLTAHSMRRLGALTATILIVAAACSNGNDAATPTPTPPAPAASEATSQTEAPRMTEAPTATDLATEAPMATEAAMESEAPIATEPAGDDAPPPSDGVAAAAAAAAALDFGSGTGSITLNGETFDFAIAPGNGVCRDVFDIIQASGQVAGDRDVQGEWTIPPTNWETYTDNRYDPPSVQLEITSTGPDNASWRADAAWAAENDKVGMSQVDSYQKDGQTASGTATFANAWDSTDASVSGSFEISCAEG